MKDRTNVILVGVAVLAWAGAVVHSLPELRNTAILLVTVGVGATTAICATVRAGMARLVDQVARVSGKVAEHAERMEKATSTHAERNEKATSDHAEILAKHVLAVERFFEMGVRSDAVARYDAQDLSPISPRQLRRLG
ncbi:hypothetical protein [Nonomuraea wenchangensis]|uniref:hypothetical protein n=1 Tax=Nonomuraea wenchangensis TaxID=568860 RepID=UPI0011604D61|nr:hypothetical protein [Nonomuraea wenchangensis]